jgi:putative DNA primase/helicase
MTALPSLREVARTLGGDVSGSHQVVAPGPGHSAQDRSLSVRVSGEHPEGFIVHSFAGDDDMACRRYVRDKLGLPEWTP